MDLSRPYRLISHPLDAAALTVLATSLQPLTGREVARLSPDGSQPGIAEALSRLTMSGIVERVESGNAYLHSLNRDHLAAPAVLIITRLRELLIERLQDAISSWGVRPTHASLFGSAARGDGGPESDIDLLVVRPPSVDGEDETWSNQLDALSRAVVKWSGNRANISVITEREIANYGSTDPPPVIAAIQQEGITLFGDPLVSLIQRARQ